MESKHLMIIGIISLFLLQNIILLEPQSHTNNNMDKIIFNNVSPSQLYYSYNISIHNSPSGNGYYQQLITLKNYSIYNINSNGSNFYVAYENNTLIYSWIQNINKTVITLWSKILNGTSEIKIDVYNNKTNLFSSNGYIGASNSISNGNDNIKNVFPFAENFYTSLPQGWQTSDSNGYSFSENGITITNGSIVYTCSSFNSLNYSFNAIISFTEPVTENIGLSISNSTSPQGSNSGSNAEILYLGNNNQLSLYSSNGTTTGYNGFSNKIVVSAIGNHTVYEIGMNISKTTEYAYLNSSSVATFSQTYNQPQYIILGDFNGLSSGTIGFNPFHVYDLFVHKNLIMPTFTQSTNQFYSLNIISKNNGTIINNSYIYNGLFYSNNYINFTVNYSKFSNFYVYALNYSTNFPQYTQFLLTINNYSDNNSGLYYFGTLTILYHTQSIKPLRETTFTQYNMYFLIVIIIFILGLIIYGYKRG